jgi:flavin reductase (DIM6/NTAB) family NADH-FMN oxidoreductase RutF
MHIFNESDIANLERQESINLINSLPGLKSVNLVGTKDVNGLENAAIFSTVIHLGSKPPLIGFIHRPLGEFGHTFRNIESTGFYTINTIHREIVTKAHKSSNKFPKEMSEFDACELPSEYIGDFFAPFVKESYLKYGLELKEILPIKTNGTFLISGEVKIIICEKKLLDTSMNIDHIKANTVGAFGLDRYIKPKKL